MIKILLSLLSFVFVLHANAQTIDDLVENANFKSTAEILESAHNEKPTNCAANVFLDSLSKHANEIDESEPEFKVRAWAHESMTGDIDALKQILDCPELKNVADDTTIIFSPITYTFPGGRTITINYSTQPKVLKQKLILANKRSLPNGNASPNLMDITDGSKYLNTEPAWYAIMVVQHDSLSEFVGSGKNNTLSMKWINDNIDSIYPHGYNCTSKSAWANDTDTINQVVHDVVKVENDSNDYYVAGDVNLEWVMYAEIAANIIITIATMGVGEAGMIELNSMRAFKTGKNILRSMNTLSKGEKVKDYINTMRKISQHTDDIAKIEKEIKTLKDADKIADNRKKIKELQDSITQLQKDADNLVKTEKDVKTYKEYAETYKDLHKYFSDLRAIHRPQTGNIISRAIKSIRAANTGAKTMNKAGRVARAGMSTRSAKIKSYLFDATLKHGARLAKFERNVGFLYGAITFFGDMYDRTSTTSKEFSNGIEFKPLCLLSADDLNGQENVVNYGMWLMWLGNSADEADDDAAYLQAMDFASKFYYQLDEFQDEHGANCNVDIYVVRPIIRLDETNVENPSGELFYLFMNEIPWSTAEQFGDMVSNIDDWERTQTTLNKQDPNNKYKHYNNNESEPTPERIADSKLSEISAQNDAE